MSSPSRSGPVDWGELRRRLEESTRRLEQHSGASEQAAAVLRARARALASPPPPPPPGGMEEIVTFRLAGETFGVAAASVLEVCRLTQLAALPGAVPPAAGVTVWRGDLLIVLDLRPGLGLSPHALNDLRQIVVVMTRVGPAAVLADEVLGIQQVRPLEPAGPVGAGARQYVRGITHDAVVILDPGTFAPGGTSEEQ